MVDEIKNSPESCMQRRSLRFHSNLRIENGGVKWTMLRRPTYTVAPSCGKQKAGTARADDLGRPASSFECLQRSIEARASITRLGGLHAEEPRVEPLLRGLGRRHPNYWLPASRLLVQRL